MKKIFLFLLMALPLACFCQHYVIKVNKTGIILPDEDGFGDHISFMLDTETDDCIVDADLINKTIKINEHGAVNRYNITSVFKKFKKNSFTTYLLNATSDADPEKNTIKIRLFIIEKDTKSPIPVLIVDNGKLISTYSSGQAAKEIED